MAKNANSKTFVLPVRWNGRRYSESADVPSVTAPSGLSATPSSTTINLSWTNGEPTAYTVIERGPDGSTWPEFITKNPGVTSHSDTGLSNGTYYYRVRHLINGTYSAYSSNTSATVSGSAGSRTLTGTGFGSEPTVLIFDRATGTDGAAYSLTADVGTWSAYESIASHNADVRYIETAGRTWMSGRPVSLLSGSTANICGLRKNAASKYSEYYIEYRVLIPNGRCMPGASPNTNSKTWTYTGSGSRWKLTWAWNSSYGSTIDTDCCYPTLVGTGMTMTGNAMTPRYGSSISNSGISYSLTTFSAVNENLIGGYVKLGSSNTTFDGVAETFQANGSVVNRTVRTNARPFHGVTNPIPEASHDVFSFSAWSGNVDQTNVHHVWADMYLAVGANAQARVYAHSAPTLAASAQVYNVTACKQSWSNTSITVSGLAAREALTYMSVISADGTLHENVSWS